MPRLLSPLLLSHPVQSALEPPLYLFVGLLFESRLDGISGSPLLDLTQDPGGLVPDIMIRMTQGVYKFGDSQLPDFHQCSTGRVNVDGRNDSVLSRMVQV